MSGRFQTAPSFSRSPGLSERCSPFLTVDGDGEPADLSTGTSLCHPHHHSWPRGFINKSYSHRHGQVIQPDGPHHVSAYLLPLVQTPPSPQAYMGQRDKPPGTQPLACSQVGEQPGPQTGMYKRPRIVITKIVGQVPDLPRAALVPIFWSGHPAEPPATQSTALSPFAPRGKDRCHPVCMLDTLGRQWGRGLAVLNVGDRGQGWGEGSRERPEDAGGRGLPLVGGGTLSTFLLHMVTRRTFLFCTVTLAWTQEELVVHREELTAQSRARERGLGPGLLRETGTQGLLLPSGVVGAQP